MDVNLRRLPQLCDIISKFLVPLADESMYPLQPDKVDIQSKQQKDTLTSERHTPENHMHSTADKVSVSATGHPKTAFCHISKFHNHPITYDIKGGFL